MKGAMQGANDIEQVDQSNDAPSRSDSSWSNELSKLNIGHDDVGAFDRYADDKPIEERR